MAGPAAGSPAGGRDTLELRSELELCPELEHSLSLLEHQRERRADAAPMPMVFMCAGCRRPVGDTSSWVLNDEESGCILLRSRYNTPSSGDKTDHC
ncbi:hypothetical protein HGM15179_008161 [Zosterops borbonicus]|uniref:Protein yippee-like n=1 Tax=Zosterops borbonicus TaxID=364589 RepID=A0A8K1GJD1_9PASS|nr:hypothetical protein HGM15179_008161 [Zosterops borbonicus]